MARLHRIAIRMIEPDKRRTPIVYRYVVMADSLADAKVLAVADWHDREGTDYPSHTLKRIAAVEGHHMDRPLYHCDSYGDRNRTLAPETIPTLAAVRGAQDLLATFDTDEEDPS
jgi:hypothetical protein